MAGLTTELQINKQTFTDKAYGIKGNKTEGFVEKAKALEQAIHKMLLTEQYEYPIYSFRYGVAFQQLLGEEQTYVRAEMKRMIRDALIKDDRILEVDQFSFEFDGDACLCRFCVTSIYGEFETQKEVTV